MRILLAREFAPGRFEKVLLARLKKDGRGDMPRKWHGSLESALVRQAARFFDKEPASRSQVVTTAGQTFRVDLVD